MSARRFRMVPFLAARSRALVGLLVSILVIAGMPLATPPTVAAVPDHLLISEVVTGGSSASDELIELYNPTALPLPLEGLELVYASASGLTVSRRAAWLSGAPPVAPFGHLLVANEAGVYASIADAVYATGMAATGGSVALRIQGAVAAVDAVGWGTATGTWLEGTAAPAPAAGSSLERLPGGPAGSGQDTNANATDFVVRTVPDPQNSASPPVPGAGASPTPSPMPGSTSSGSPTPSVSASPIPEATPDATPTPTSTPTPTPVPAPTTSVSPTVAPSPSSGATIDVAAARSVADGTSVSVEAVALTDSGFTDGGGYVADGSAGIAVLVTDASFARGELLRIAGTVDDRYAQRTLRADAVDVVRLGMADPPAPRPITTAGVGEGVEGSLVRVSATITGGPTALSSGSAYDVDDGSGVARVLVATVAAIDTSSWRVGSDIELIGVVGQRDSSGTGTAGYRLQPRDAADVLSVTASPSAAATASASPGATASSGSSPSPAPAPGIISIADARDAEKNARVTIRGVVTLPTGVVDEATAVVQDGTAAIVLRMGDDAGSVARGRLVQVTGARSTKGGMETIRVTTPPSDGGAAPEPTPLLVRSGEVGEGLEARLVAVRGAVAAPRHASSGTVSFEVDDGSGPLRVVATAATGFDEELASGDWIEVVGVVGQETSGAQPLRGYRLWPRDASDLRVTASATEAGSAAARSGSTSDGELAPPDGAASATLGAVQGGGPVPDGLEIGATLVASRWPELGIAGLLWDGERLVAIDDAAAAVIARSVPRVAPPLALRLTGLRAAGTHRPTRLAIVSLGPGRAAVGGRPASPTTAMPRAGEPARWVTLVGRLVASPRDDGATLAVAGLGTVALVQACASGSLDGWRSGQVSVTGIGSPGPATLTVGCDGIRAAPVLAAGRPSPAGGGGDDAAVLAAPGSGATTRADDGRRLTALLILLVGLVGVIGAVLVRAVARSTATPAEALGAEEGGEEGDGEADGGTTDAGPGIQVPTLTLVAAPRERGP